MTDAPTIAIIHAPADALFAASMSTTLLRQGYTVQSSTRMPTPTALTTMIHAAQVVLVVLSPAAERDAAFAAQWQEAFTARKSLIPLIAQPSAIPPVLQIYQWIVFADRQNEAMRELLGVLPPVRQTAPTSRHPQWRQVATPVAVLVIVVLLGVLLLHRPASATRSADAPTPTVQIHGRATFTFLQQSGVPTTVAKKSLIMQPNGVFTLLSPIGGPMYRFDPKTDTKLVPLALTSQPGDYSIVDMCVGPDGNVWYIDDQLGIGRVNPGGAVTTFSLNGKSALALAAGTNNDLWFIIGPDVPQLGRITTSGAITYTPLPNTITPEAIAVAPDGSMWFYDRYLTRIYHRTLDGIIHAYQSSYTGALGLIAVTSDGTAWVQEFEDSPQAVNIAHSIIRVTANGQLSEIPLNTGIADSDEHVNDLISGADGKLWFTSGKNIAALNLDGSYAHIYRLKYPANVPLYHDEIVQPDGIVQGVDGTIWVSSSSSDSLINLIP